MADLGAFRQRLFMGASPGYGGGGCADVTVPALRGRQINWAWFCGQEGRSTFLSQAAYPTGYYPGAAKFWPLAAGEMSLDATGSGALTMPLIPAKLAELALSGAGDIIMTLGLVKSMAMALSGSGSFAASIIGRLNIDMDLSGAGDVEFVASAIASMFMDLEGSGDLEAALTAIASMQLDITVTGTGLTTTNVGEYVWGALAAAFNDPGTMGAALNAAGSAGDPWITTLPGSYTSTQAGGLLYIINQILKNKQKTDPNTGIMTVYADDGVTPLFTANVFNDADGTQPYDGTAGINLKDKLT